MKQNQKQLTKVNDLSLRNKDMYINEHPVTRKRKLNFFDLAKQSTIGTKNEDKYYTENEVDCSNDRFMIAEGLRPGLVIVDRTIFIKTSNDKSLVKDAKRSSNNKLKDEFLRVIIDLKKQPKFNFNLIVN